LDKSKRAVDSGGIYEKYIFPAPYPKTTVIYPGGELMRITSPFTL